MRSIVCKNECRTIRPIIQDYRFRNSYAHKYADMDTDTRIYVRTFIFGPASALSSRMSSGFCTKERATQSMDRVRANSKSLTFQCDVIRGRERRWVGVTRRIKKNVTAVKMVRSRQS